MSATTAASVPEIFFQPSDNHLQLQDQTRQTQMTLNLGRVGPLVQGATAEGPVLEYRGTEGTLRFSGQQIVTETTALGKMYTVTLRTIPDRGSVLLTVLVPAVIHDREGGAESFETIAIKSEHHTSLQGIPDVKGANPTYSVVKLHGTAARVAIPA